MFESIGVFPTTKRHWAHFEGDATALFNDVLMVLPNLNEVPPASPQAGLDLNNSPPPQIEQPPVVVGGGPAAAPAPDFEIIEHQRQMDNINNDNTLCGTYKNALKHQEEIIYEFGRILRREDINLYNKNDVRAAVAIHLTDLMDSPDAPYPETRNRELQKRVQSIRERQEDSAHYEVLKDTLLDIKSNPFLYTIV